MLDTHTVHTHMRGLRNRLGSHGSYLENRSWGPTIMDLVTDRRRRMKLGFAELSPERHMIVTNFWSCHGTRSTGL